MHRQIEGCLIAETILQACLAFLCDNLSLLKDQQLIAGLGDLAKEMKRKRTLCSVASRELISAFQRFGLGLSR